MIAFSSQQAACSKTTTSFKNSPLPLSSSFTFEADGRSNLNNTRAYKTLTSS
jgi:hypothetical protein